MLENEIEIKVLGYSVDELIAMVERIGASFITKENQVNYRFTNIELKGLSEESYLRLRVIDGRGVFTLKERKPASTTRQNIEMSTPIPEPDTFIDIMKKLGYSVVAEKKERIKYKYMDFVFDIDKWDDEVYPYPYMEIEANSENEMDLIIKKLKLDKSSISTKSIKEIRDSYFMSNK